MKYSRDEAFLSQLKFVFVSVLKLIEEKKMLKLYLILTFSLISTCELTNQLMCESANENEKIFYEDLLKKFYQQEAFNGILMINVENKYSLCHNVLKWLQYNGIPVTQLTGNQTMEYHNRFSNEILTIACTPAYRRYDVLEQLAEILNDMRYTRIIIVMDGWSFAKDLERLNDFFKYCHKMKMLSVVVILKNFYKTHTYSQYNIFPEYRIEFGVYQPDKINDLSMLPDRLRDLKGYKLRTIANHDAPHSMEYYDENNKTVLVGYMGRFMKAASQMLNATLYFPVTVPFNRILNFQDIVNYRDNSSIDIPISNYAINSKQEEWSYPIEFDKWCFLLPIVKRKETKEVFLMILHSQVMYIIFTFISIFTLVFFVAFVGNKYCVRRHYSWPEILVNDMAIRGVLGQGFVFSVHSKLSIKQIYVVLLLTGLTITTIFSSHLQSLATLSPYEPEIQNYHELLKSNIKVAIYEEDYKTLHNLTNGSLAFLYKKFRIMPKAEDFVNLRDSFDPRYAYPTTADKIYFYSGLELYHRTKLFRYSSNMCFYSMMQFAIPLGKNSYFRQRLYAVTLAIWESGLLDFWMKRKAFDDVVAAGKVIKLNISYDEDKKPLTVEDLYWIWLYYVLFCLVAIIVFIFELLIYKMLTK